ncbi:MAG: DUF5009 domain-containing protein [Thermoanaerobaculia bacterium]
MRRTGYNDSLTVTTTAESIPPSVSTIAAPVEGVRERLTSLDVFRGITIAGMLLVNDPGSWGAIYPPLEHAPWHGWTPTDLIFPFFLFIVGITTHLSLTARRARGADERELLRQILRRGTIILLIGLFLNAFPFFAWWKLDGIANPTFMQRVVWRFAHMRFPGVLPRIGVAYMIGALLTFRTSVRQQLAILGGILVGYWAVMTLVPVPGTGVIGAQLLDRPELVLSAWLDRIVFGPHLWAQTKTWDPEGLLSTVPAVGTVILGVLAGRWIGSGRPLQERLNGLFAVGSLTMVAGLAWNWVFPINKNLWTSSYVLFTAGMGAVTLATCIWIIDVKKMRGWSKPFVVFGINPILAFAGSAFMARMIYSLIKVTYQGRTVPIEAAIYHGAFASWLPPRPASLAFAICFVLLWLAILWPLHERNIIIKI